LEVCTHQCSSMLLEIARFLGPLDAPVCLFVCLFVWASKQCSQRSTIACAATTHPPATLLHTLLHTLPPAMATSLFRSMPLGACGTQKPDTHPYSYCISSVPQCHLVHVTHRSPSLLLLHLLRLKHALCSPNARRPPCYFSLPITHPRCLSMQVTPPLLLLNANYTKSTLPLYAADAPPAAS
jgi:hypothetical protein